ncbi:hypothetical protein HZC21_01085 [Candidatus Peregrinibacteria bacterium]|nr:hypothetical protein [Candidatus Peregrinibacteria bacterium]
MDAGKFIKELQSLYFKSPQISHWTRQAENCDYGDIIVVSRNCYLCFYSSNLENCFYCHDSRKDRFSSDLTFCEDCELCYECVNCVNCYNGDFLQDCKQCRDSKYCYYCIGCNDCFGCAGLQRKQFHIFNKPYSKDEYFKKLEEIKRWPAEKIQEEFEKIQLKTPRVFTHQVDNENSFGDYLYHNKNCFWCFDSYLCEDSMYIFNANLERGTKDCLDCGPIANTFERCYDIAFCGYMFDCDHMYWCDYMHNCQWCINAWDSNHMFGCVYIKNKEYLILNKRVSREEYEKTTQRLNKELAKLGVKDLYGLVNYELAAKK